MKLYYILAALSASAAMAAPAAESEKAAEALAPQACLPASCQSFGVSTTHCISKSPSEIGWLDLLCPEKGD